MVLSKAAAAAAATAAAAPGLKRATKHDMKNELRVATKDEKAHASFVCTLFMVSSLINSRRKRAEQRSWHLKKRGVNPLIAGLNGPCEQQRNTNTGCSILHL